SSDSTLSLHDALPICVHGDDVITPRYFAGFVVTVREAGERIRSQTHDRVLVVAPVHPVNTIAFDVLLWIRRPLEMTGRALFFRRSEEHTSELQSPDHL